MIRQQQPRNVSLRNVPSRSTMQRTQTGMQSQGTRSLIDIQKEKNYVSSLENSALSYLTQFGTIQDVQNNASSFYNENVSKVEPKFREQFKQAVSKAIGRIKSVQSSKVSELNTSIANWQKSYDRQVERIREARKQGKDTSSYKGDLRELDSQITEAKNVISRLSSGEILDRDSIYRYISQKGQYSREKYEYRLAKKNAELQKKQETVKESGTTTRPTTAPPTYYYQTVELLPEEVKKKDVILTKGGSYERIKSPKEEDITAIPKIEGIEGSRTPEKVKEIPRVKELPKMPTVLREANVPKGLFENAQNKIDEEMSRIRFSEIRSREQIAKINNPYLRALKKLEQGYKTTDEELRLGTQAGIIAYGTGIKNIPEIAKNVVSGRIGLNEIAEGTKEYIKSVGKDILTRPIYGVTRTGVEAGLDILTGKVIDKGIDVLKGKPVTKFEVERLATARLIGDNRNIKLNLKTYTEITNRVPKVTKELEGIIRGKLFYTAEGKLNAVYSIYSRNGKRISGNTILQIGSRKIDDLLSKSDDVITKTANNIIKTRNMDFTATARINLRDKTLELLKSKATNLSPKEWNFIKNAVNEKIAVRKTGTKEGTFGFKAKELKQKVMSQADAERLKKIFEEAMKGKKPTVNDLKFLEYKNTRIKIFKDSSGRMVIEIPENFQVFYNKLQLSKISPYAKIVPYGTTDIRIFNRISKKLGNVKYTDDINKIIIPESEELLTKIRKKFNVIETKRLKDKTISVKLSGKLPKSDTTIFAQFTPKKFKNKRVYDEILRNNENIKRIALKRQAIKREAEQMKRILDKAKRYTALPKQEARLLLENKNLKIKITILEDGTKLIEIPDIYSTYRTKLSDVLPQKTIKKVLQPQIKRELFKEVVNPDGTVLLQKLEAPRLLRKFKTIKSQKLKSALKSVSLQRTESLVKLEQRLRQKTRQAQISKQKILSRLNDPIIAYRVIQQNKSKLNRLATKFVVLNKLLSLSKSKLSEKSLSTQSLQVQKIQLNNEKRALLKESETAKATLKDKIISLRKDTSKKSETILLGLRALVPVSSTEFKYLSDVINQKKLRNAKIGGFVKTTEELKKPKLKLSWNIKPQEKNTTYLCNGLIKSKGKIRELRIRKPVYKALKYMINLVDNTTARSFGLKIIGLTREKDIKKPNLFKFRAKISSDPLVLGIVEKSKYAIDSKGEKKGLSIERKLKRRGR